MASLIVSSSEWWVVGVVVCMKRGADCLHTVQLMPLHPKTSSSLALFKSRPVLPFWYRLTQAILDKRSLMFKAVRRPVRVVFAVEDFSIIS